MELINKIYRNYVEPLVYPWGYSSPVDECKSYVLRNNMLINGVLKLFSSQNKDGLFFDYIFFEDTMTEENRSIVGDSCRFYLFLDDLRNLTFYNSADQLMNNGTDFDLNSLNIECKCRFSHDCSDILSDDLIFCKLTARKSIDSGEDQLSSNSFSIVTDNYSIFYSFVFGLSTEKCVFLFCHLKKLCPLIKIKNSNFLSDSPQKFSLSTSFPNDPLSSLKISDSSDILSTAKLTELYLNMPSRSHVSNLRLAYSTNRHGMCLSTMYRRAKDIGSQYARSPTFLLIIKEISGTIFGAMITDAPHLSSKFYGNGESFVYTFKSDILEIFPWSGSNYYFVYGSNDNFSIGSDDGHNALWIDERLDRGVSQPCTTYKSPTLSNEPNFRCNVLELWAA